MIEIDTKIAEGLITGLATLGAGIIGAFINERQGENELKTELHRKQLDELYEPLMEIFMRSEGKLSPSEISQISDLLYEHNSLAAPALVDAWKEVTTNSDHMDSSQFYSVLLSNYNWVKKCLGYPYLGAKIDLTHLPTQGINKKSSTSALLASIVLFSFGLVGTSGASSILIRVEMLLLMLVGYTIAAYSLSYLFKESGKI